MASARAFCSSVNDCHWSSVASDCTEHAHLHMTSVSDIAALQMDSEAGVILTATSKTRPFDIIELNVAA